jgi:signal transduction histidine kinase
MRAVPDEAQQAGLDQSHRSRFTGVVLLITLALSLFSAAQIYYSAAAFGQKVSWPQALYWGFGDWCEWALLSPFIFFLCQRFQFDRQTWPRSLVVHVFAGLVFAAVHAGLCAGAAVAQAWVTHVPIDFYHALRKLLANRLHYNFAVYALIICAWHAWNYYRRYREREAQTAELAARLAQAQLETLRMQLNPHFLFNCLNTVSSLMLKDVKAANRMLSRLGDLLRLALETGNRQEVPLRQELDFVRRYVEIEQIRFGERLCVKIEAGSDVLEATVPNLILQPLVENAIRHGIEGITTQGEITLRAARTNGNLLLEVSDNGQGFAERKPEQRSASAETKDPVGLNNTRQRLEKLYGTAHTFDLHEQPTGGVSASLTIPFRVALS